ncbi:MAG: anti-sigma factor antagonist [Chloroflexota bacterium]|nr:MAG: anti-sigma factor antagonist [Chloroflexota bacterium]
MDFKKIEYKRCDLVKPSGRIDGSNAPQLEEELNALTEAGRYKIVIDMTEVNFMSSAGWWVLIRTQKKCKRYKRGEVVLACVDEKIRSSLDLVGMGSYFRIFDDITAAVGNF